MKVKYIKINPSSDLEEVNKELKGSTHVETYTIEEKCFRNQKTIIVHAFYPDDYED